MLLQCGGMVCSEYYGLITRKVNALMPGDACIHKITECVIIVKDYGLPSLPVLCHSITWTNGGCLAVGHTMRTNFIGIRITKYAFFTKCNCTKCAVNYHIYTHYTVYQSNQLVMLDNSTIALTSYSYCREMFGWAYMQVHEVVTL